jgi:ribosomal protein S18 acetylase RimI-like enzyme
MASMLTVRRATLQDATTLSAFAERAFRDAFAAQNAPANMDLYCLQAFSAATQSAELGDPAIDTVLLEDGSHRVVAYAQLRVGPVPKCVEGERPIELVRFYVDRAEHGRGVARQLWHAVLEIARERRAKTIWLGVWEHNQRARAFYGKVGLIDVGSHEFHLGTDIQTDRLMALTLD